VPRCLREVEGALWLAKRAVTIWETNWQGSGKPIRFGSANFRSHRDAHSQGLRRRVSPLRRFSKHRPEFSARSVVATHSAWDRGNGSASLPALTSSRLQVSRLQVAGWAAKSRAASQLGTCNPSHCQVVGRQIQAGCTCLENRIRSHGGRSITDAFRHFSTATLKKKNPMRYPVRYQSQLLFRKSTKPNRVICVRPTQRLSLVFRPSRAVAKHVGSLLTQRQSATAKAGVECRNETSAPLPAVEPKKPPSSFCETIYYWLMSRS
jgi:hypothetical protein